MPFGITIGWHSVQINYCNSLIQPVVMVCIFSFSRSNNKTICSNTLTHPHSDHKFPIFHRKLCSEPHCPKLAGHVAKQGFWSSNRLISCNYGATEASAAAVAAAAGAGSVHVPANAKPPFLPKMSCVLWPTSCVLRGLPGATAVGLCMPYSTIVRVLETEALAGTQKWKVGSGSDDECLVLGSWTEFCLGWRHCPKRTVSADRILQSVYADQKIYIWHHGHSRIYPRASLSD